VSTSLPHGKRQSNAAAHHLHQAPQPEDDMLHATLNSNGINRVVAITVDPASNPAQAAEMIRMFAAIADAYEFLNVATNLRSMAANAAELAKPDQVAESGS
jgi:hypothetical protein